MVVALSREERERFILEDTRLASDIQAFRLVAKFDINPKLEYLDDGMQNCATYAGVLAYSTPEKIKEICQEILKERKERYKERRRIKERAHL